MLDAVFIFMYLIVPQKAIHLYNTSKPKWLKKRAKPKKVRKALTLRTFVYYQEAISVSGVAAVFHIDYRADKVQHLDRRLYKT